MKINNKGAIDMMFIVLLVVLVAVSGVVAWRLSETDKTVQDTAGNTESGSTVPTTNNSSADDSEQSTENETEAETSEAVEKTTTKQLGVSFALPEGADLEEREDANYYGVVVEKNNGENPNQGVFGNGNYKFEMQVYEDQTIAQLTGASETTITETSNGLQTAVVENTPSDGPGSTVHYISNGSLTISLLAAGDYTQAALDAFIESIEIA